MKRKGDTRINTIEDLNKLSVGTQVGTGGAITMRDLDAKWKSEGKSGFDLKMFNSSPEAVLALASRQIDAAVSLLPMLQIVVNKQPDVFEMSALVKGKREYLGWAARPDDKAFRDYLSSKIKELRDSGKLYQLQEKWFGFRMEIPDTGYLPEGAI